MEHVAQPRFSGRARLALCAVAIVVVALAMSIGPGGAEAASPLVVIIEMPEHHLGDGPGNEGTAFQKTFTIEGVLSHPELVFDIAWPFYEDPPRVSLNGTYLGSLRPFFPPLNPADPLWQYNDDGSHDYNGTLTVRFPVLPRLQIGVNTFRIENGRADDNYLFSDVRIEDHWVMLGVIVEGTISDGHGHDVEDARLTLYHDGETTPLATTATAADGSFELKPDELVVGEKYRVTAELESEDHRLVMKESGTMVSFSREFSYDDTDSVRLDFDCSKVADLSAASTAKGDVDNCASVWHWLQLNRQVAQGIGQDLTATLTVNVFSTADGGTGAWYDQSDNSIHLGAHVVDDDSHDAAPDDAVPAPWQFLKNRETHEFGHALMNVVMGGAWVAEPDIANHAGYANRDTGDSLSEGFAEFWCMFVDETAAITGQPPDQYDDWGYLAGPDRRMAWAPVDPASPMATPTRYAEEEFAAAGLLRDLQGVLGGGQAGFLKIADNLPAGGNLTDFRDALVTGGVAAAAIDPLFFSYGFFADTDGDWTHDAGEPVGAGNGTACKLLWDEAVGPVTILDRPSRHDHPFDPDSFVVVKLSGVRSAAQESWVKVAVKHTGEPAADFSQRTLVTGASGLIYVYLDEAATGAVVTATGPDDAASPDKLSFTAAEWKAARSAAVDDVALTKTFRVNRVTVGDPVAPKTMSPSRSYAVTCTLRPHHAAGTFPVRVYKYRYVSGKWRSYGYVKAKASDFGTGTRCSCTVKLSYMGKWRLRALAPADTYHRATWSRGYDYVTVR
jgi:hypothetical protein